MIELRALSKRYGDRLAVDDLTLTVRPGRVTGLLGPNGAGKSTTMRMIMGLDRPSAGTATVAGKPYAVHQRPLNVIGAVLDARAVHPRRTARNHLQAMAASHGIARPRVDEVLAAVGLTDVADKRAGSYSLGMSQRLGIAGALLGDPQVLMLDEPVNGLDPDGVRWIRALLRRLADEGRTVFVSSHLMSEMQQTADWVVVIGRGRLIADTGIDALLNSGSVRVRGPELAPLAEALAEHPVTWNGPGEFVVASTTTEDVGRLAFDRQVCLYELQPVESSLEQVYMELTADSVEYAEGAPR